MQHKNVVTFAVLVLASFNLNASKGPVGTVKKGFNCVADTTVAVVDNKHVNRVTTAATLAGLGYLAYKFGPELAHQSCTFVKNKMNKDKEVVTHARRAAAQMHEVESARPARRMAAEAPCARAMAADEVTEEQA